MIQGLIFDFDGLILDTEGPIYRSWRELYEAHGCSLPPSQWVKVIGVAPGTWDPFQDMERQLGQSVDREKLGPPRRQREIEMIMGLGAMPGVLDYLQEGKRLGLKIGLASSSSRRWVTAHLTRLGLIDYFDCIRTSDDVKRTKPDPELYLSALGCLGINPHQALGFEDSPNGILAAKGAGLYCVAVPNDMTRVLPLHHADLRLESLADLPLSCLLEKIEVGQG